MVPIRGESEAEAEQIASNLVAYKRPLVKYGAGDEPWCQEVYFPSQ